MDAVSGKFLNHPEQASQVRRFVRDWRPDSAPIPKEVREDLELVADEMFANAVQHGDGDEKITVELGLSGPGRLRIAVEGPVSRSSEPTVLGPEGRASGQRGRGMMIVNALCPEWGFETYGTLCKVWGEMGLAASLAAAY